NWLPPDNLQVDPDNGIAHRTSPTNIGLYLASVVTARDFGYITTKQMVAKIGQTIDTLERLPRWEGHFYNWYNTVTLEPLLPLYVSTVDSGNLLVYLLVAKEGIKEWLQQPWAKGLGQGVKDTVRWKQPKAETVASWRPLFGPAFEDEPTILTWYRRLKKAREEVTPESRDLLRHTLTAIEQQLEELEWFFPWLPQVEATGAEPAPDLAHKLSAVKNFGEVIALAEAESVSAAEAEPPALAQLLLTSKARCEALINGGPQLCARLETLITAHGLTPLYDRQRRLFAIGYNVTNQRLDSSYYNILASEARQASFMAIALGQVPIK